MRSFLPILGALLCAGATLLAQSPATPTAMDAVKLLPKGEAERVARIEAREGKPEPSRWHILVHDPEQETGVREYVVVGDEIVASRSISQFAEKLKESEIIGADSIKIDSDKVSKLAQQYALANNAMVTAMDYELVREGDGAAPLWKVTCLDEAGKTVGSLVLTATKGTVVSHEGFPIEPAASQEKLAVHADSVVGEAEAVDASTGTSTGTSTTAAAAAATGSAAGAVVATSKAAATPTAKADSKPKKKKTTTAQTERRSEDEDGDRRGPRFGRRIGGKLQRFFTGRDTISR